MTKQEAEKVIDNEDYLPWQLVATAKQVLGMKEQTAQEEWAELFGERRG